MKLLITLGCSWTFGVGVNYATGMDHATFSSNAWNEDLANSHSFRGILSQRFGFHNINLSRGGSSNQTQFRSAENFFSSDDFQSIKDRYSDITVLWGLTSVFRNEAYFVKKKARNSFFYSNNSPLSKVIITEHFDQQHEIYILGQKIKFWDKVFDALSIKNIWFDTFNHHDYSIPSDDARNDYHSYSGPSWPLWEDFIMGNFTKVPQVVRDEILDDKRWDFHLYCKPVSTRLFNYQKRPRDLLSQLCIQNGMKDLDNNYHLSDWKSDGDRIEYLTGIGLLNPYTNHPTHEAHRQIADMLSICFV